MDTGSTHFNYPGILAKGQSDDGWEEISCVHVKARFKFANGHLDDPEESWEKVMWSDETKIELFGHNSTKHV